MAQFNVNTLRRSLIFMIFFFVALNFGTFFFLFLLLGMLPSSIRKCRYDRFCGSFNLSFFYFSLSYVDTTLSLSIHLFYMLCIHNHFQRSSTKTDLSQSPRNHLFRKASSSSSSCSSSLSLTYPANVLLCLHLCLHIPNITLTFTFFSLSFPKNHRPCQQATVIESLIFYDLLLLLFSSDSRMLSVCYS